MAEEQRPPEHPIGKAIRSEPSSKGELDLSKLNTSLVKSSLWKANTLRRIENARAESKGDSGDDVLLSLKRSLLQVIDQHRSAFAPGAMPTDCQPSVKDRSETVVGQDGSSRGDLKLRNEYAGMRKALATQVKEVIKARHRLREQEAALQERGDEIRRLRQTVAELRAENSDLSARHKDEVEGQETRLAELEQAYDQFQEQADQLLAELDEENARLRAGDKHLSEDT